MDENITQQKTEAERHATIESDLKFAMNLTAPQERVRSLKDLINLCIALMALVASFYSVFVTHRDAQENLRQTQRAYLAVQTDGTERAKLTLRATGGSPAREITVYSSEITVADDAPDAPSAAQWKENIEPTLGPFVQNALLQPGGFYPIPPGRPYALGKDKTVDISFGTVMYKDVFGIAHTTHYCFRAASTPCEKGNDAD